MQSSQGKLNLGPVNPQLFFKSLLETIQMDAEAENRIVQKLGDVVSAVRRNSATDVKVTIGVSLDEKTKSINYEVHVVGK